VDKYLGERAVFPFSEERISPKVRKRGDALSSLEGIFKKVEAGEMTVENALEKSKALLGEDADSTEFYNGLECSLKDIPFHPQEEQLELDIPVEEKTTEVTSIISKPSRTPRPQPAPTDHYRVVVWRDSKDDQVKIEVTKR
jgi:hypothetical protein